MSEKIIRENFLNGDMKIYGDLIEYPPELEGGRNLFRPSLVNSLALSSTILANPNYRGFYFPVSEGEVYTISRSSNINNRFRYVFTIDVPKSGSTYFGGTENTIHGDSLLKFEDIIVPKDAKYLFLYLSNQSDELPNIKIEKGSVATPWTPAPEDLGLDFPDWITHFKYGQTKDGFLMNEFIEYPVALTIDESVTDRNLFSLSNSTKGYLSTSGNIITPDADNITSGFIPITEGDIFTYTIEITILNLVDKRSLTGFCFYDKDKKFIVPRVVIIEDLLGVGDKKMYVYSIADYPSNAKFIRIGSRFLSEGKVKLEKGSVATPWTPALEDLNKEIMGRNLLSNSDMNDLRGWVANGISDITMQDTYIKNTFKSSASTPGIRGLNKVSLKKGMYTLSVKMNTDGLIRPLTMYLIGGNRPQFGIPISRKSGMDVVSITFEVFEDRIGDYLYILTSTPQVGDFVLYDWMKLELGVVSTSYTKSPEDLGIELPDWMQTFGAVMDEYQSSDVAIGGELTVYDEERSL